MPTGEYLPYAEYGPAEPLEADPYAQCLTGDFFYSGNALGPLSTACKIFMAQRCAKRWDNACEVYSMNTKPNMPNELTTSFEDIYTNIPEGQKFIRNTADRKFCTYTGPKCFATFSDFNPTAPNTPVLTQYGGECFKVCNKIGSDTQNDHVISKCLANPGLCDETLLGLCYESARTSHALDSSSALGGFCATKGRASFSAGLEAASALALAEGKEGFRVQGHLGSTYGIEKQEKYGPIMVGGGALEYGMPHEEAQGWSTAGRVVLVAALAAIALLAWKKTQKEQ